MGAQQPGLEAQSAQAKFGLGYVDQLAGACAEPLLRAREATDATPIGHGTFEAACTHPVRGARTLNSVALADLVVDAGTFTGPCADVDAPQR